MPREGMQLYLSGSAEKPCAFHAKRTDGLHGLRQRWWSNHIGRGTPRRNTIHPGNNCEARFCIPGSFLHLAN